MSVRAIAIHNLKKRMFSINSEKKKKVFKALITDITLPQEIKFHLSIQYQSKFPQNTHLERSSNKCIFTGRTRAI
ncbi:MAG: hypothetical protein ACI7YS_16205 [Flavobacterium sp.]